MLHSYLYLRPEGKGEGGAGRGWMGGDLNTHGIQVFNEGLPTVVCIISKQVDLHLRYSLHIPSCTNANCAVITIIWGFPRLLFDECVPADKRELIILCINCFTRLLFKTSCCAGVDQQNRCPRDKSPGERD